MNSPSLWLPSHCLTFLVFSSSFPHLPLGWWGGSQWPQAGRGSGHLEFHDGKVPLSSEPLSVACSNCSQTAECRFENIRKSVDRKDSSWHFSLVGTYTRSQAHLPTSLGFLPLQEDAPAFEPSGKRTVSHFYPRLLLVSCSGSATFQCPDSLHSCLWKQSSSFLSPAENSSCSKDRVSTWLTTACMIRAHLLSWPHITSDQPPCPTDSSCTGLSEP